MISSNRICIILSAYVSILIGIFQCMFYTYLIITTSYYYAATLIVIGMLQMYNSTLVLNIYQPCFHIYLNGDYDQKVREINYSNMIGIYISLYGLGLLIIRYSNHHHVTMIITKLTLG